MPAVNLSPIFNGWQAFTSAGLPLSGGLLNTYIAGSSTPQATYTTSAGSIANSNPIVFDAAGRPPSEIWLVSGVAYKFVLTDSLGLNPLTYDNIAGIGDIINLNVAGNTVLGGSGATLNVSNGAITVASGNTAIGGNLTVANNTTLGDASTDLLIVNPSTVTWSNNPTHSGNHTFTGSTILGDALGDTLNVSNGALKVFSDGRVSGNKLHNIGSISGTTDQFIASGTYTPAGFTGTNVSAVFAAGSNFTRVGNVVNFSITASFTFTVASTNSQCGLSIPIASTLSSSSNLTGVAIHSAGLSAAAANPLAVIADTANNRILVTGLCGTSTGSVGYNLVGQYEIK
jgi:hypothetical protein